MTTCVSILVIVGKVIGWILIAFLALFLFFLFVPVSYRVEAVLAEEDKSLTDFQKLVYCVRIAGIRIYPRKEKKHKKKSAAKKEKEKQPTKTNAKKKEKKKSTAKGIASMAPFLLTQLRDEENKELLQLVTAEVLRLGRHYGPRRGQMNLYYNLTDPSYTGIATGVLSLFPISYKKGVRICPDFVSEEGYVYGNVKVKGHVRLIHAVRSAFHFLKNQKIRQLLKTRR